jgi:hypothetical protein
MIIIYPARITSMYSILLLVYSKNEAITPLALLQAGCMLLKNCCCMIVEPAVHSLTLDLCVAREEKVLIIPSLVWPCVRLYHPMRVLQCC